LTPAPAATRAPIQAPPPATCTSAPHYLLDTTPLLQGCRSRPVVLCYPPGRRCALGSGNRARPPESACVSSVARVEERPRDRRTPNLSRRSDGRAMPDRPVPGVAEGVSPRSLWRDDGTSGERVASIWRGDRDTTHRRSRPSGLRMETCRGASRRVGDDWATMGWCGEATALGVRPGSCYGRSERDARCGADGACWQPLA
jgi:hypothetical protein